MEHQPNGTVLAFLIITVLLTPVTALAIVLRTVVVRRLQEHKLPWGIDDWLLYVALVFLMGLCIAASFMYWALEQTQPNDLTATGNLNFNMAFYVAQIVYHFCMLATKLSILFTYIRIFADRVSTKWFKKTVQILQVALVLYSLAILVLTIVQCQPVSFVFDWTRRGNCVDRNNLLTAVIVSNITSDAVIIGILIVVVWSLRISLRKRCIVYGTMMIGCIGFAVAFIRLSIGYVRYNDQTTGFLLLGFFMAIEPAIVIVGACVPLLKPLLHAMTPAKGKPTIRGLCCSRKRPGRDEQNTFSLESMTPRQLEAARESSGHVLWSHNTDNPREVAGDMANYRATERSRGAAGDRDHHGAPEWPTSRLEQAIRFMDSRLEHALRSPAPCAELPALSPTTTAALTPQSQRSGASTLATDLNKPLPPRPLALVDTYSERAAARRDGGTDKILVAVAWPQAESKHASQESVVEFLRPTCYGQAAASHESYKPLKLPRSHGLP